MSQTSKDTIKYGLKVLLLIGGGLLGLFLAIKLAIYLMPFVIGWLVALCVRPVVRALEKGLKIRRGIGSAIVTVLCLVIAIGLIYLVIVAVVKSGKAFLDSLPGYLETLESDLAVVSARLYGMLGSLPDTIGDFISSSMSREDGVVSNVAGALPLALIGTIVAIFSAYYFMAEEGIVRRRIMELMPGEFQQRLDFIKQQLRNGVGGYFRAQLIIMVVIFVVLEIAFLFMSVPFSVLWAFLIALLDFLPFFGTGFVLIPWAFIKLCTDNWKMAVYLVVLYVVCLLLHQLLQPKLLSSNMGMHPLWTLFCIFVGYRLGGIIGLFLGLLIGMVLVNLRDIGTFDGLKQDWINFVSGLRKSLRPDEKAKQTEEIREAEQISEPEAEQKSE